jgi:hypothetical protein
MQTANGRPVPDRVTAPGHAAQSILPFGAEKGEICIFVFFVEYLFFKDGRLFPINGRLSGKNGRLFPKDGRLSGKNGDFSAENGKKRRLKGKRKAPATCRSAGRFTGTPSI